MILSMTLRNGEMLEPTYELVLGGITVTNQYKNYITNVEFEDSDCEAGLARIDVNDMDFIFSNKYEFHKGVSVELSMGFNNKNRLMLKGEVTHFEASFDDSGVQNLTIGAIDTSNSMNSVKKHRSWKKVRRSDVVTAIAREYGYKAYIQNSGEVHDQISQENESDAQFIKKLAGDEGFEFYVFPDRKALYFGDKFSDLSVKDTLYYKIGDQSIISFSPSLVERNKKENVDGDGHSSSDKSHKSGKKVGSKKKGKGKKGKGGDGGGSSSGGYSGNTMSATVSVEVEDDDGGVDIVGLTGAQHDRPPKKRR